MAQQTTITLIDDTDPSMTADETVTFALDGKELEIDLAEANAQKLRELLKPFVAAARRASGGRRATYRPASASSRGTLDRERNQAMRNWANNNGFELSDRGRIPEKVVEAWAKAGSPMDVAPAKPKFEDPEPVPGTPWNDLDAAQRTQVKAWAGVEAGIDPSKWTRNFKHRDAMSGFAVNNDTKGAKAYINAL